MTRKEIIAIFKKHEEQITENIVGPPNGDDELVHITAIRSEDYDDTALEIWKALIKPKKEK